MNSLETLSIIYSTDESIDTTLNKNGRNTRNNTESDNYKSLANDDAGIHHHHHHHSNIPPPRDSYSSNLPSERENFLSLLHMIKYKYKDNKDLSDSLYKLMVRILVDLNLI